MNLLVTLARALAYRTLTQLANRYQKDFVVMEHLSGLTSKRAAVKKRLEGLPSHDQREGALADAYEALRNYRHSGLADMGACGERTDEDCPEHAEYTCDYAGACPYLRNLRAARDAYDAGRSEDEELARLDAAIDRIANKRLVP